MADETSLASLIPNPKPAWLLRAMDRDAPSMNSGDGTEKTVKTTSNYSHELGGEVLYPTIRLRKNGKLFEPKHPFDTALAIKDYILVPGPPGEETQAQATRLSKHISRLIGGTRNEKGGSLVDKPLHHRAGI